MDVQVDIWGLGCVLVAMLTGGLIWPVGATPMEIMMTVAGKRGSPEVPAATPAPLAGVIRKCFTTAQADRPTAELLASLLMQAATALGGGPQAAAVAGEGLVHAGSSQVRAAHTSPISIGSVCFYCVHAI